MSIIDNNNNGISSEASRATTVSDNFDDRPTPARAADLNKGDKVRLIFTTESANLTPGATGVVLGKRDDDDLRVRRIDVRWANGSRLSMIDGENQVQKIA